MKILSDSEIVHVSGAFSLGSLVLSATEGAIVGAFVGLFVLEPFSCALVGAATLATIDLTLQVLNVIYPPQAVVYEIHEQPYSGTYYYVY